MVRKILGGLLGVVLLLVAGCTRLDDQVRDVSEWAAGHPALGDVRVQQLLAGGIPTDRIEIRGSLHVDTVDQLCDALADLREKQEEMERHGVRSFEVALEAHIDGVFFEWRPSLPDLALIPYLKHALPVVVVPEVDSVLISNYPNGPGPDVSVVRRENGQEADDEAVAFRDRAYRQLEDLGPAYGAGAGEGPGSDSGSDPGSDSGDEAGAGATFIFEGFPLTPGGPETSLNLSGISLGYTDALAFVESVDVATDHLSVVKVGAAADGTTWEFRGEGEFNDADFYALKPILSSPPAGETAHVLVRWDDGSYGRATVGAPREEQAGNHGDGEWSARMQEIFAADD